MNTDLPKVVVLWSDQGDHAGFMFLAVDPGSRTGKCVFMLSPSSIEGIDSNIGIVVSELKAMGEHRCDIESDDSGCVITVLPSGFPEVELQLDCEFRGRVFTELEGGIECIGFAEPADGNA